MIRRSMYVPFIVLTTLGLMVAQPGATLAQASLSDLLHQIPGLQTAYARRYMSSSAVGLESKFAGTPVATTADRIDVTVLEFEDASAASTAFRLLQNDDILATVAQAHDVTMSDFTQVGLGDKGYVYIGAHGEGEGEGALIVQDGNLGIIVNVNGAPESIQPTLLAFGTWIVDAEPGSDPVILGTHADSTGGSFDVLPGAGDTDVLGDLRPMYDYDLMVSDSPIEATPTR